MDKVYVDRAPNVALVLLLLALLAYSSIGLTIGVQPSDEQRLPAGGAPLTTTGAGAAGPSSVLPPAAAPPAGAPGP